jgi:hypothetical protein
MPLGKTGHKEGLKPTRPASTPPFVVTHRSLKTYIIQSPNLNFDTDTIYAEALLGAAGGLVGSVTSAPADVLVTRIITQASSASKGAMWRA